MKKTILTVILSTLLIVSGASAYTVISGDTLFKIADKYNISLEKLVNNNPQIVDPNRIHPGQEIFTDKKTNVINDTFFSKLNLKLSHSEMFGGTFHPVQVQDTYLSGSGISSTATSITLTEFVFPDDSDVEMTDFGDIGYATLEPNTSREENVSFTGITQNANGTATLTGVVRGLLFEYPYTTDSGYRFSHAGGTIVRFSNSTSYYSEFAVKRNDETIKGVWQFDVYPVASSSIGYATTSWQFISLGQFNAGLNQGAATSTYILGGIVRLGTNIEMASSTYTVLDPTVISTRYSSSTPSANATDRALFVPIAKNSGYIDNNWLDLSENWTFTGSNTFSGSNVFSGGINASSTTVYAGFGGIDTVGALSIAGGTTTTLSTFATSTTYTSLTIADTGALTFGTNYNDEIIRIRVQGDCVINGTIVASGRGSAGASGGAGSTSHAVNGVSGATSTPSNFNLQYLGSTWDKYLGSSGNPGGTLPGQGGPTTTEMISSTSTNSLLLNQFIGSKIITPGFGGGGGGGGGAGAGGGSTPGGAGGAGGRGGGAVMIECGGSISGSGGILANGDDGTVGVDGTATASDAGAGGGGGAAGSGGMVFILYGTTNTYTGTINVSGGTGGAGGSGADTSNVNNNSGGGGGGTSSFYGLSGDGGAGGALGVDLSGDGGDGADGVIGAYKIEKNISI